MNYNVSNLSPSPSAWAVNSRGLHPWQFAVRGRTGQFAPWGPGPQWGPFRTDRAGRRDARFARAHRTTSARARRRRVKVSSTFSKVAGGAGARWAPFSARSPLPRRSVLDVCHWQTAPEAAAETLAGIFDATETSSEPPCHPAPSVYRPLFSPAGSVSSGRSPLGSCAISDGGGTRMCAGR